MIEFHPSLAFMLCPYLSFVTCILGEGRFASSRVDCVDNVPEYPKLEYHRKIRSLLINEINEKDSKSPNWDPIE